jgi:hypothetical protein
MGRLPHHLAFQFPCSGHSIGQGSRHSVAACAAKETGSKRTVVQSKSKILTIHLISEFKYDFVELFRVSERFVDAFTVRFENSFLVNGFAVRQIPSSPPAQALVDPRLPPRVKPPNAIAPPAIACRRVGPLASSARFFPSLIIVINLCPRICRSTPAHITAPSENMFKIIFL